MSLVGLLLQLLTISSGGFFLGLAETISDFLSSGNRVSIIQLAIAGLFSVFFAFLLGSIIVGFLYFPLFESSSLMATPGKLLLGLKVSDEQDARLTFKVAFLRSVAKIFSMLIFGLGFLLVGIQPEKRGLHDLLTGTRVRKTPKCTWESIGLGIVLAMALVMMNNYIQPSERSELPLSVQRGKPLSREEVERLFNSHQNKQLQRPRSEVGRAD